MKKRISFLMLAVILFSCTKNDDISTNQLNGEWNLIYVSCLCEPVVLEVGEHIWTFDLAENKLYVVNNVTEPLHTLLDTGTYVIEVLDSRVIIQTTEYDYYFENEKLYLADHPELDGPLIEFVRD